MKIKFSINKKQLILDYKTLGSLTGISKKYNICRQTVANRLNKLGIFYKTKILVFDKLNYIIIQLLP